MVLGLRKGRAQVLNVLLQLLDDGRITDSQGRTVDCSRWASFLHADFSA